MKISSFIVLLCFSIFGSEPKLSDLYHKGNGHIYKMTSKGFPESTVSIYNANVKANKLWVEFYIESGVGIIQTGLWQQFLFERQGSGALDLKKGYIKSKEMIYAEELPSSHLKGSDSLKMSQFLFKDLAAIKKYLKGKEEVTVPAGTVMSSHYQIEGNGQTINFWIAEDSKPLTMVKLISKGNKKVHNYKMELLTLAKNIKAKIDPNSAKALSEKMRKTLEETPLN